MSSTQTEVYNIFYVPEKHFVQMNWTGYATSEQFRQGTEVMLNLLVQNKATKVLADIKDMLVIGADDQKWLETQFLPRAIKFGFKSIAMVKPHSYFNKVAVETISYKIDKQKLSINFFDTAEEATTWLENQ